MVHEAAATTAAGAVPQLGPHQPAAHSEWERPPFSAGAEEEAMSEGQLRARIAAWEREKQWAPAYVADQLEAAQAELRAARENVTIWTARAESQTDPAEAEQLRAAAERMCERVAELEKQVADLQFIDDARAA